jgi:hypothetical protein
MTFRCATTGFSRTEDGPLVHAVRYPCKWIAGGYTSSLCGVRIMFVYRPRFTHLHARACPKCVKIVQSEGG